ncbi:hypothetical protein PGN35_016970 [Nodosilinea sp. PGN35]|uniref:hypothetical protein n=1 Tax=Nodosilinea sp. PGN35 TaxID=3020489 RepID=UPI0023B343B7|nr:hypothetical protein [Nodosilinea sp. TSF1-S3]MDF0369533.1 hypothetical protein [Nodosilinea sp. TSF1-S3]
MTEPISLTPLAQQSILKQFRLYYGLLVVLLAGMAIVGVAWQWSLPKANANGVPFGQGALILLAAAVLVNLISFFFQDRYVQSLLKQPNILREFAIVPFGLRFYAQNLAIAIVLSLIGFYPLLLLLFFFAHYPIVLWLMPYHLILGFVLGWVIKRQLL